MSALQAVALLFWPVVGLAAFWLLAYYSWRIRRTNFGWALVSYALFILFAWIALWFAFVVGARIYTIATHGGTAGNWWPIYWPLALAILLAVVIYEIHSYDLPNHSGHRSFRAVITVLLVAIIAYLVLLVSLPNVIRAADSGSTGASGTTVSAATFSWKDVQPGTCLAHVTGVNKATATSYTTAVKAKTYDPRALLVINEPALPDGQAQADAFAQGVPRAFSLHVLHVSAVWVYGSGCTPTLDSHQGVWVTVTIPKNLNHPRTSPAREDVGVLPMGPWKVASAPAAA